ncbi:MAG: 16S rRNA processing protein RimM [Deltaproteobacteria bacterium]|nr:16S rRNA processing protein RimM [Deltaproteobacteria bacterium]
MRPHGVCGDLLVKLFNPDSDFIFRQKEILLSNRALQERVRITRLHRHGESFVLMTIAGCDSRARAEQWRGFDLCVERSALPRLSPGEFYYSDLIDLKVTTPQGVTVGEVKEVITYPTADVLSVTSGAGYIEIPMVEPYWVELDLEAGIIVVDHIDDLSWFYPGRKKKG